MDYMDIDEIESVPDTPERLITARNNDGNSTGRRGDGSSSCRVIDRDFFNENVRNEPRERGKSVTINGSRRLFVRADNSSSSKNALPIVDNACHDKGKSLCNSSAQKSASQGSVFVDLTEQNEANRVFGKQHLFPVHGSSALDTSSKPFGLTNNSIKLGPKSDRGKGVVVGGQHKVGSNLLSLDITPPRVNRHKRLVRNGCISPHNIAKSKQVAEKHETVRVPKDLVVDTGSMPSDGPSNTVDIKDLIAEAKDSRRFKGKGVSHHPSFLEEPDARSRHVSHRNSVISKEATDASKESEGWITTHNTVRKVDPTLVYGDQHISGGKAASNSTINQQKNETVQRDHRNRSISSNVYNDYEDFQRVTAPPDTTSLRAHNLGQFKERAQLTKRQREGAVALSNIVIRDRDVQCFNDSEIASSSVPGEPSTSRLTRVKNRRGASTSAPVIAIDELPNEDANHDSSTNQCINEDSGVRALQLEADEMLARELQEQLYNEELGSAFGFHEQEQSSRAIHLGGRSASRPAFRPASRVSSSSSSSSNLYQHSRSNASRNPSLNRGPQAQTSSSSRLARLRGRFPGRPRSLSSTRNSIFPPNMNVDMRMEILEALEAFNDMELPNDLLSFHDMGFPNQLLQMGREFNENDYEMLLALDENNHRHGGATRAQINSLPQSTVQAENLQECAICLETPTIGETIRHLPCLHRFHKDCIDEWLKRKTSCPVCKSSVT